MATASFLAFSARTSGFSFSLAGGFMAVPALRGPAASMAAAVFTAAMVVITAGTVVIMADMVTVGMVTPDGTVQV